MNIKIRERRSFLKRKWVGLRLAANCSENIETGIKLREQEDKVYKLWKFYDGLIKDFDSIKKMEA